MSDIDEVHCRTLPQWVAWYRRGGLDEVRSHPMAGPGRPGRLDQEQLEALRDELERGTLKSPQEMARWVYELFGVKDTPWGIR